MPIVHRIDHDRRLVLARGVGIFHSRDPFEYQQQVWSCPDVAGYDELVDMSGVTEVDLSTPDRMRQLAGVASATNAPGGGERLAIVAPTDLTFGLARMYESHRALQRGSTKNVGVFRTLAEAPGVSGGEGRAGDAGVSNFCLPFSGGAPTGSSSIATTCTRATRVTRS